MVSLVFSSNCNVGPRGVIGWAAMFNLQSAAERYNCELKRKPLPIVRGLRRGPCVHSNAKLRHGKLLRNNGSAHQRAGHSRLGRTWPRNDLDAASGTRSASGDVW